MQRGVHHLLGFLAGKRVASIASKRDTDG